MTARIVVLATALALLGAAGVQAQEQTGDQPAAEEAVPLKKKKKALEEQPQAEPAQDQPAAEETAPVKKKKVVEEQPQAEPAQDQPAAEEAAPVKKKKKAEEAAPETQPPAEQAAPEAKPDTSPQVAQFLEDGRAASELSDRELVVRIKRGRALLKAASGGDRAEIASRLKSAQAELAKRQATAEQPAPKAVEEQKPAEQPEKKQAEEQPQQAASEMPPEVAEFLKDTRPSRSLSDNDLQARIARAKGLMQAENLPGDARVELRRRLARAQAELDRRGSVAAEEKPQPDATTPPPSPPADTAQLEELKNERPAAELDDAALAQRIARNRTLLKRQDLAPELRVLLKRQSIAAAAEVAKRKEGGKQTAETPPPAGEPPPAQPTTPGELSGTEKAMLAEAKPASALSDAELKDRLRTMKRVVKGNYELETRQAARRIFDADRIELQRRVQTAAKPPTSVEDKKLDSNPISPELEAKAKEFLAGSERATALPDDQLRQRLYGMRDVLQQNRLSPETERLLRERLSIERDVLRTRVVAREAKKKEAEVRPNKPKRDKKIDFNTNITIVLNDRRPSDELEYDELERRIDVYRDAIDDDDYDFEEREYWRRTLEDDRRALRARLLREREERAREYRRRVASNEEFDIEFDAPPPPRPSVWAAEADDEEIEGALVAAPRRKVERRYTIDDIERDDEVRAQMPALEIDTVKFGFNESFLREEEIAHLDRIAGVIEKILAARPSEVFLIEGHTDAVGSETYNLELSRKRARAVKEALSSYYVIPEANLETVGYGERYLKIPTADPEPENRRVSLRRVTPLVGARTE